MEPWVGRAMFPTRIRYAPAKVFADDSGLSGPTNTNVQIHSDYEVLVLGRSHDRQWLFVEYSYSPEDRPLTTFIYKASGWIFAGPENDPTLQAVKASKNFNLESAKDYFYDQLDVNKSKDRKSTRLNSSHIQKSRMPSSA